MVTAALIACAAMMAATANRAGAIIVKLHNGHYLSFDAQIGGSLPAGISRSKLSNRDSIFHNLDYSGGPVMPSNTNYVIAWTPQGYSGAPFQDKGFDSGASGWSNDSLGYINGVAQFFKDLQTDSSAHKTTNSDAVSVQYDDANGHVAAYNSSYGAGGTGPNGAYLDTDPIPGGGSSGCPWSATSDNGGDAKGSGGYCITDAQVQQELNNFLTAHSLPRGLTDEYFLLTPPDVVMCFTANGAKGTCSANSADSDSRAFCGYHSNSGAGTNEFLYANIPDSSGTTTNPDPDGLFGCDPYVTNADCNSIYLCDYYAMSDGVLSAVSHEHNETITDPQPNSAWTDFEQNPPYQGGTEIGDLCNDDAGSGDATTYVFNNGSFHYYPYNETIGSRTYWIQGEWSNEYRKCLFNGTFSGPPGSSFQVRSQSGNAVSFDATGSCGNVSGKTACAFPIAEYTWQFNDDVTPGDTPQEYTVSCPASGGGPSGCNGALVSHTFPRPGTYRVALTTQNMDGRTSGWATNVTVYAATRAAFSFGSSAIEHSPVSFNAGTSTHDPHFSITSYSWNFGDGSPLGSGVSPSHSYSHSGNFIVTLTVHDSHGGSSTVSHVIGVADRRPSASFTAPSGTVGRSVSFTGHGSDPDEGIASYRWSFGDGSSGSGQHVRHTFRHSGTFHVTLTVRDASGQTASIMHKVVIKKKKRRHR